MKSSEIRQNEVAFCADVKSWADALIANHPEWPFSHVKIEQYGIGSRKRSDLRVYRKGSGTPVLAGEVKLPGTPEGRSPYDSNLMQDAFNKADNIQSPYFFTWNINTFALFDRSKWNVPLFERRVRQWELGTVLTSPLDCSRPDVQQRVRDQLLPAIFAELARIVDGKVTEWGMRPDDLFIRSLESHLEWPVLGTRDYLIMNSRTDDVFATQLQSWMAEEMNWTFDPNDDENWAEATERAARTLCYVFCNRAIFYEAIRAKFPQNLTALSMPRKGRGTHHGVYEYFRNGFKQAVLASGDYEPVFYPHVDDWAGSLVFASDQACEGWRGLFVSLAQYNFRQIPHDIIGGIFQKLISPEERQKFGQFFTGEDIVDIVNAFCIRRAGDRVIDPACGSGSFLVRAYHRKAWLSEHKSGGRRNHDNRKRHFELLQETCGCDIALFAAHLATLNLAARRIEEEENYPLISRGNFFETIEDRRHFFKIPGNPKPSGGRELVSVPLASMDAVIGNPPYVRQEQIPRKLDLKRQRGETKHSHESRLKTTKEHLTSLCSQLWPGLKMSGRSDLHCYFWPVAASLLDEGGYFGFLTSSSWLDVEYGFPLQRWILKNFKLVAVLESLDEPWFQDARVKTSITILQRCTDERDRMDNTVRFARFFKPVKEILGLRPHGDESARQNAAEALRKLIVGTRSPFSDDRMRIIPIRQSELWTEGLRAANLLRGHDKFPSQVDVDGPEESTSNSTEADAMEHIASDYAAGKWGRFLRAPDLYFRLMRVYGNRFVRLGEVAEIRFGIKSGCDAFFMPRDVTNAILTEMRKGLPWHDVPLMRTCKRSEIEDGKVRVVRAGDNTLHPVETKFLRPEVHSLMEVHRPVIRVADLDRVVLWVNQPLSELIGTYAEKYIRWGAKQTFASKKSKAVPVPLRSSCAGRPLWYDLTGIGVGKIFWPMAQKYRHIAPLNPDGLVCNHNLFYLDASTLDTHQTISLCGVLNSTIVALFKHFYGRYAGSEGTLKTEVVDTVLLEIPDPRAVQPELAERMKHALDRMSQRKVTHMVDEALLRCHSQEAMRDILNGEAALPLELRQEDRRDLDGCVFELLGVTDQRQRETLIDELYTVVTAYYGYQRTQDIQSTENRSGKKSGRISPQDLAESIWRTLDDKAKRLPVTEWIASEFGAVETVHIPDGKPDALGSQDMFNPSTVKACEKALSLLGKNLLMSGERYEEAARSRTGTLALQEKVKDLLMQWRIHGRGNAN
ncbi:MAG: N-6 DNA methylase [Candidatus Hydrogenedentes bacterium]|nr:N-6 DNA methylase [Candidatus Hydrogenedentota bacterium]